MGSIWLWVSFNLFVLALLALDLGVFHRKAHAVSVREATIWSVIWISLSMASCLARLVRPVSDARRRAAPCFKIPSPTK